MRLAQRYSPQTLRSDWRFCLLLVTGVLWVSPLSAQVEQRTLVPDVNVNLPPLEITNNINVMSDSAMIANLNRNLEALRIEIAADQESQSQGPGTVERTVRNVIWVVLGIIAVKKLHDIATRPPDVVNVEVINEGDDVTVNVPPHEHDEHHDRSKGHRDD